MPKNKKTGIPSDSKKVHIIGEQLTEKDKRLIDTAVQGMIQKVEPLLNGMGQMLDAMDKRVQILEELVNATLVDILAKKVEERLSKLESPGK